MPKIIKLTFFVILLTTLASCTTTYNEPLPTPPSVTIESQETNTPIPTPEVIDEVAMNHVLIDLTRANLEAGKMTVTADYLREETDGNTFLLNRDFEVTKILCDGQDVNVDEIVESIVLSEGYYEIKQYTLPKFEDTFHIEYTGLLSGKSGLYSSAKEQITTEFTLLRNQTVYRPMFIDVTIDDDPFPFDTILGSSFNLKLSVKVSDGYTAVLTYDNATQTKNADGITYTASGYIEEWKNWIAVAKYEQEKTEDGDYYFVESVDSAKKHCEVYYSDIVFEKPPRIVEIPRGLSSLYINETNIMFLESDAFNTQDSYINPAIEKNKQLIASKSSFNILFIGNSLTIESDVPAQTQKLAQMYGINITYDTNVQGGSSISKLMSWTHKALRENKYDYVIMQDIFGMPNEDFMAGIKEVCDAAKEQGAIPVLYCPAYGDIDGSFIKVRRFFPSIIDDYEKAAKANNALMVNAAGAWIYSDYQMPDVSLAIVDDGHPNSAGAYLTACTILSTLFDIHVKDICTENTNYTGDDETALKLGQRAWEFVNYYKQKGRQPLEAVTVADGAYLK